MLPILRELPDRPDWQLGGGTSLAIHYDHRTSYDVDLFVDGSHTVQALSPNRNPATRALLAGAPYEYPGNYLKLRLPAGEIDIIVAAPRTTDPTRPWNFEGETIRIDTPWETAIKKMFFRPSQFLIRDIFDLAAVVERNPDELAAALPEVDDRLARLIDRIDLLRPVYAERVIGETNPTAQGRSYQTQHAVDSVLAFLRKHGA